MEKIVKALDVQRTSFTTLYEDILKNLDDNDVDIQHIRGDFDVLEQIMNSLKELDKKLMEFMLHTDDDIDIDAEAKRSYGYCRQFNVLKRSIEKRVESVDVDNSIKMLRNDKLPKNLSNDHSCCNRNWPKFEIVKFSGEIENWLTFWSQFKRIHEDVHLEAEDKLQYLRQAIVPNSRASLIVESYPPLAENYEKVIESLKGRFGRDELLVEYYVRELLKLILNNVNGKVKLSFLYDKIESRLRVLESLKVTTDKCAAILYPLIESCLPEDTIRVWQRSSNYCVEENLEDRLRHLMIFLRPTQRIYKLEMDSAERKNILPPGNLMKTRSGRIVKAPQRLNS